MARRQCSHCKEWIEEGLPHDCWTTSEAALTADLSEDLREAWERLRDSATELGEQRIYASHKSIMFSRKACYSKFVHIIPIRHRDEVEAPVTDWLQEAYAFANPGAPKPTRRAKRPSGRSVTRAAPARTRPRRRRT